MKTILCMIFLITLTVENIDATTIITMIGDKDGFGIGIVPGPTNDIPWNTNADGDNTDELLRYNLIGDYYTFDFLLSWNSSTELITNTTLEIFHAHNTTAYVKMDNIYIGQLTEAEGFSAGTWPAQQAVIDIFNIPVATFIPMLADGILPVTILAPAWDGYFIDYLQLSIESVPIPEPTSMILFGFGLLGLAGVSRKKLQQ